MTPSVAPPSWVTLVQPSRVSSEVHLAVTLSPSGSIGYLSADGRLLVLVLAPAPVLVPQAARPIRPAVAAEPSRKFLRETLAFMFFSFVSPCPQAILPADLY